jgi:hypothetical protein
MKQEMQNSTAHETVSAEAKLTRVLWISYFDWEIEKRVSDWELASTCARCGRSIVHVYTVTKIDGSEEQTGRECAWLALGWKKSNGVKLDRLAEALWREDARFQESVRAWGREAEKVAVQSPKASIVACRTRNYSRFNGALQGNCLVYRKDGTGYYAIPESCNNQAKAIEAGGWVKV